jgi:hypothetical protein
MNETTDKTPTYQPPAPPLATSDQAKPIVRMLNKMLRPKFKMPRGKGVQSDQQVHVKHKKVRFY